LLIASCSAPKKESLILGNENWVSSMCLTYLTKAVLEEKGYTVEVKNKKIENILADMDQGRIDLFMDVWYEGHSVYLYEFPNLEDLGTVYDNCEIGLAVPEYFNIDSVSQLSAVADSFGGMIYGIREDAGVMIATASIIEDYAWENVKIKNLETNELSKQLDASTAQRNNFVTAAWKPDWKNDHFYLNWLTDTTGLFGKGDKIQKMAKPGFSEENPELAEIIKKIYLSEDQLTSFVNMVKDNRNPEKVAEMAQQWMKENRELVDEWVGVNVSE